MTSVNNTPDNTPDNTPNKLPEWFLPGGLFIWIISLHEVLLFSIGIAIFKYQNHTHLIEFSAEKTYLNLHLGVIYTVLLLASGWMIAESLASYLKSHFNKGRWYLLAGIISGLIFLAIKLFDFYEKIHQGKQFGTNSFWTLYWFLNSFHFIHILIGSILLSIFYLKTKHSLSNLGIESFTSLGIFWHACDIIWILIFSTFYLNT